MPAAASRTPWAISNISGELQIQKSGASSINKGWKWSPRRLRISRTVFGMIVRRL